MRKFIASLALGAVTALSMTSCLAGPHQLRRSVDDWDAKMYASSPWLNGVLWFPIPVFYFAHAFAGIGDFFVTDAYHFWLHDAWDGKGTGFTHVAVETDNKTGSMFVGDGKWLQMSK